MPITPLVPGSKFPTITLPVLGGGDAALGQVSGKGNWQLIVVYRGKHCPICTGYLQQFEKRRGEFDEIGVELLAVSSDSEDRAKEQIAKVKASYPVAYDLSIEQMRKLGLMISGPQNGTDVAGPFPEPGMFVVDHEGMLRIIDIANAPIARPDISTLLMGLKFIKHKEGGYAVSGIHDE